MLCTRTGIALLALTALAACGTTTTSLDGFVDVSTGTDATASDAASGTDATIDSKDAKTKDVVIPSCASRAGAYAVEGTCSGGTASIPFACMLAKDCQLTWAADYRTWTGPLTGNDFALASADGKETITGAFDTASTGSYQYASGGLTCDATMAYMDPGQADSLCCDVLANDCKTGDACVVVSETAGTTAILTTGCIPLAASPTAEGGACSQSATETGCAVGSLCVRTTGGAGNDGICRKFCQRATDCKPAQQCDIVTDAPRSGICDAACAPFAGEAGGDACPAGQNCLPTLIADGTYQRFISTTCGAAGTAISGGACGNGVACGVGLVCVKSACTPLCDTKHPCASGTCAGYGITNASNVPAGFGFCQ